MNKKLIAIAVLLILTPCSCWAWMSATRVIGANVPGVAACNVTDNEVGDRSVEASSSTNAVDYVYCGLYQSDCSATGKTKTGYIYSTSNNNATGRICVYSDLGTAGAADSSDLLLSCSWSMGDPSGAAWAKADMVDMDTAVSIAPTTNYWVCLFTKTAAWNIKRTTASGTMSYRACVGCLNETPSNLSGSWSTTTQKTSAYVTLGP